MRKHSVGETGKRALRWDGNLISFFNGLPFSVVGSGKRVEGGRLSRARMTPNAARAPREGRDGEFICPESGNDLELRQPNFPFYFWFYSAQIGSAWAGNGWLKWDNVVDCRFGNGTVEGSAGF